MHTDNEVLAFFQGINVVSNKKQLSASAKFCAQGKNSNKPIEKKVSQTPSLPILSPNSQKLPIACMAPQKALISPNYTLGRTLTYFSPLTDNSNPCPLKTLYNERIYWNKRKMGSFPLLIINFEGALGDYYKENLWNPGKKEFFFRNNIAKGLMMLKNEFYIVLLFTFSKKISRELLEVFESFRIIFDAVYRKRHRVSSPRYSHNITSIIQDFSVPNNKVLTICAAGLDLYELQHRDSSLLICDPSQSSQKRFLTYHAGISEEISPVIVVVPHYRMDLNRNFIEISVFVLRLKSFSTDFFHVHNDFHYVKTANCFIKQDLEKESPCKELKTIIFLPQSLEFKKVSRLLTRKLTMRATLT